MNARLTDEDTEQFAVIRPTIQARLREFAQLPADQWLREVALCLLTPQSSPVSAEAAMVHLEQEGFFENALPESHIAQILRHPSGGGYVRFHITKAKRLVQFLHNKKTVEEILHGALRGVAERNALREAVIGFGLKEASHALRNIGRSRLGILDRHILKCLRQYQVIDTEIKSLNDSLYLAIEKNFLAFADYNDVSVDELDLFFWWKATGFIYK